jgi:hypothetical protein
VASASADKLPESVRRLLGQLKPVVKGADVVLDIVPIFKADQATMAETNRLLQQAKPVGGK